MLPRKTPVVQIIIMSAMLHSLVPAGNAQGLFNYTSDTKNHCLWFKGHWNPAKKNVFIIDKDSLGKGGGTITITAGGDIQLQSSGKDEWNKTVEVALKSVDDWEKKLDDPASNTDLPSYHLNT